MEVMPHPLVVERMRKIDIAAVMEIESKCYPRPWQENAYYTELNNPSATYLVGRSGEKVEGFAGMWVVMDEAHLTTLAVDPLFRNKRVGEKLLNELMAAAVNIGARRATLEVRESNGPARRLYAKYGFRDAAIRRNYYTDNQENAIVMWADDLRDPKYALKLYDMRVMLYRETV